MKKASLENIIKLDNCCPNCGGKDFSEYENDNGASGPYKQEWTDTICNNCGKQV